ncbi:MAG: response regulator [Flavobacteriales bacterium]
MDTSSKKLDIVLLDDQVLLNILIQKQLSNHHNVSSIKAFDKALDLYHYKELKNADILFLDILMPEINGLEVIIYLREKLKLKNLKIFIISSVDEYQVIQKTLRTGADGFFSKFDSFDFVVKIIDNFQKLDNKPVLSPTIQNTFLEGNFEKEIKLSPREKQLLELICQSNTAKEIAFDLDLSLNTVHFYTKRLMKKMSVNRTQDLIIKAIEEYYYIPK